MTDFNIVIESGRKTKRYALSVPSSWQEYKEKGYDTHFAIGLLTSKPLVVAQTAILFAILQKQGLKTAIIQQLDPYTIAQILAQCQFLKPSMSTTAHIEHFTHRGIVYHFPSPQFGNGTALEFALADEFFLKIGEDAKTAEDALRLLTATLCREDINNETEAIKRGDKRIPLVSRPEVVHRAALFTDLDPVVLTCAFLYFAGCKKYINDNYGTHLFAQKSAEDTENEADEQEEEEAENAEPLGWWGVFMELAGQPTNLDTIHNMNFHTLCLWLVRQKMVTSRMRQHLRGSQKTEDFD